ncbi:MULTISPECIES: site-specific DNA-methyltransferase [Gilliamella]|uniref:site-specific DNA-methyltransferase n=1 Tax=Gilliamella TaxID=1193503 RepID=UPI000A1506B7|nr:MULTISPECIES: site-specific DNA-methyltransferase [Gilliamella]MCO6537130.1 site-specific DNA-methyltransferase [Gilliamella sp.]MWP61966.1 hypothetical protein [Gilliamella sp. Pas-s25]
MKKINKLINQDHLYIESDNLFALEHLIDKYKNRINLIYIDPPYNTGNSYVYNDCFSDYKGFTWSEMMSPRLELAKSLLAEDGAIFISIDDNELVNLRLICDNIFGKENFIANIIWQKKYSQSNDSYTMSTVHEYIIVYQKTSNFRINLLPRNENLNKPYKNDDGDGKGVWRQDNLLVKKFSLSRVYPIVNPNTGKEYYPPNGNSWRASKETMNKWLQENRIYFGQKGTGAPQLKRYLNEVKQGVLPTTFWSYDEVGHTQQANKEITSLFNNELVFDTPKPVSLIKKILQIASKHNDIILDFFAGSATTAHATLELNSEDGGNRKFIMIQSPEHCNFKNKKFKNRFKYISDIGKERINRAGKLLLQKTSYHPNWDKNVSFKFIKMQG